VRLPVGWLLDTIIATPLSWVGWHIEIPVLVKDYFAVGFILAISLLRSTGNLDKDKDVSLREWFKELAFPVSFSFGIMLFWPIFAPIVVGQLWADEGELIYPLLFASPLVYLGILLALNFLVLS